MNRADATPSKVTVIAEQSEIPSPIFPPTQIVEEVLSSPTSPPLPQLVKRMEGEGENPFRPEETLFHEVDPIVEAYLRKPYPPSLAGSPNATPAKNEKQPYVNGISPTALMPEKDMEKPVTEATPLTSTDAHDAKDGTPHDAQGLPRAGKAELVHIEKKKCGCCTVQ